MAAASFSVVHLTMRFDSTVLSTGSGMLHLCEGHYYIITAWHNLTGRHPETLKVQNTQSATPNNVIVAMIQEAEGMAGRIPFVVQLTSEDQTLFYVHPENYPRIDVAVIPLDVTKPYPLDMRAGDGRQINGTIMLGQSGEFKTELCPLQKYEASNPELLKACIEDIDVTDELFIPSYPENVTDYLGNPIWKRATVASSVRIGWNGEPKFLIDSASRPGMSGAPVFYYSKTGEMKTRNGNYYFGKEFVVFFGIYVGRMASKDINDAQVGIVWKREVVDEIIHGKRTDRHPDYFLASHQDIVRECLNALALYSKEGIELILNDKADYRYYARNIAHRNLEGRATPDEILECILDEASRYEGPFK